MKSRENSGGFDCTGRDRHNAAMSSNPVPLFFKAHVDTYTRKDGTVVQAHDDKRQAARRPIKKGDRVRIKPEYQDDGDDKYTWHAVDDEDKGRVTVSPKDHPMSIKPTYVLQSDQVDHHEDEKPAAGGKDGGDDPDLIYVYTKDGSEIGGKNYYGKQMMTVSRNYGEHLIKEGRVTAVPAAELKDKEILKKKPATDDAHEKAKRMAMERAEASTRRKFPGSTSTAEARAHYQKMYAGHYENLTGKKFGG